MKKAIKKYFIPHAGNNFHPHILHPKRAVFYGSLFLAMKAIVVVCVILLPLPALMTPDILQEQQQKIVALTNDLRAQNGVNLLKINSKLIKSSDLKALDMAQNGYFSHTSPQNHGLSYYLSQAGYKYKVAGENLAMGFTDAQDVVDAWKKSLTHYNNLVDVDYEDLGVSVENGYYNNIPTVYVVQHFGTQKIIPTIKSVLSTKIYGAISTTTLAVAEVTVPTLEYDKNNSVINWTDDGSGTTVSATATIVGNVKGVVIKIQDSEILLSKVGPNIYVGSQKLLISANDLFKVVINPAIIISGDSGQVINDTIPWSKIKIVSPTPVQKYIMGQNNSLNFASVFNFSQYIYIGFIIFFSLALLLSIFIEIKKQHPHIIVQTLGLIGLLVVLVII